MKLQKAIVGFLGLFTFCNCASAFSKTVAWSSRTACTPWTLLLLLTLPTVVQAQFTYTTNSGTITITGYTGSGGAVIIPDKTNGLPVTSIGNKAFYSCTNLISVTMPNSITSIGDYAFSGCTNLPSVTIPNNVTSIGYGAFSVCRSLTSVKIPNSVTIIEAYAFAICSGVTNVAIPNSVVSIGGWTFNGCTSLTTVTIPNSVTNIGDYAFEGCASLTNVTIGNGFTSIGNFAFYECGNLTSVYFQGNAPNFGVDVFVDQFVGTFWDPATVYYLPGTTGWPAASLGVPEVLWNPQAQAAGVQTNQFGFNITGTTNIPIVVEACTNLASASWTSLQSCTITNGSIYFSDPQWTKYPTRFYRVRSP